MNIKYFTWFGLIVGVFMASYFYLFSSADETSEYERDLLLGFDFVCVFEETTNQEEALYWTRKKFSRTSKYHADDVTKEMFGHDLVLVAIVHHQNVYFYSIKFDHSPPLVRQCRTSEGHVFKIHEFKFLQEVTDG